MKRMMLGVVCLPVLLYTACKKDDTKPGSIWMLGDSKYEAYSVTRDTIMHALVANAMTDAHSGIVYFIFNTLPGSGGTYKVISNTLPGPGEICIASLESATDSYTSTGNDNKQVHVEVKNDKINIKVDKVWVKSANNPADSQQLSAKLYEF